MTASLLRRNQPPAVRAISASRSHVGHVRPINEDRIFDCPESDLWAIADGMGGHQGGDLAAQAVIDSLRALVQTSQQPSFEEAVSALTRANQAIISQNELARSSSGATVVLAIREGAKMRIAWAGDSRAYVVRNHVAKLLTRDHSVVQELIDAGLLSADQALVHPQANVVTRALGIVEATEIETMSYALKPHDRLLLCSDGLSRSLRCDSIPSESDVGSISDALIAQALASDGSDNVSLIIIDAFN